jgi:hypothetical protein
MAAGLAVDLDLECFFAVDFVVLAAGAVFDAVLAAGVVAAFDAGAGVPCAANDTPAIASARVMPMILEAAFFIFLSVLFFGKFYLVPFCL